MYIFYTMLSSFNNINYQFISKQSTDIQQSSIKYAENNLNRNDTIKKIYNLVNNIKIAIEIESSIFEYVLIYCINYDDTYIKIIYEDKLNSILLNLDVNSRLNNTYLIDKILNNEINPKVIAFLTQRELCPAKWNVYVKKIEYQKWRQDNMDFSKVYECPKCGEFKSRIHQIQMRSLDEPPTTFIICLICKNSQKID